MSVYRGRFAPSPTGSLHLGSLLAALTSYLQARSQQGQWLLRIEDVDICRTVPGAADSIFKTLEKFALYWDEEVLWQSQRLEAYRSALEQLEQNFWLYPCTCTRKTLTDQNIYPGTCRIRNHNRFDPHALRVITTDKYINWTDVIQGCKHYRLAKDCGDFIVLRRDGLFAYQLAVVVDDAKQEISEVVRGTDLLESTPKQIHLQQLLGLPTPSYCHIPILVDTHGHKLSKQSYAKSVDTSNTSHTLHQLLRWLNHDPPKELKGASASQLLDWAVMHWRPVKLHSVISVQV